MLGRTLTLAAGVSMANAHSWIVCTDYEFLEQGEDNFFKKAQCSGYSRNIATASADPEAYFGCDGAALGGQQAWCGYRTHPNMGQGLGGPESAGPPGDLNARICRAPRTSAGDPISSRYTTEYPMATWTVGQQACLIHPAQNHCAGTDYLNRVYASPVNPSLDPTLGEFRAAGPLLDFGAATLGTGEGFQNCPTCNDNNNRFPTKQYAMCNNCFTVPDIAPGVYTMMWYWRFHSPIGQYETSYEDYYTCFDVNVVVGGGSPTAAPPTPATSPTPPPTPPPSAPLPTRPSTEGLAPGCYHWLPTGCSPTGEMSWNVQQFDLDNWGMENANAARSLADCNDRKGGMDWYCNVDNAVMHFVAQQSQPRTYSWREGAYGPCSEPCDTGTMSRAVDCVDNVGVVVGDGSCSQTKPSEEADCNTHACGSDGGQFEFSVSLTVRVSTPVSELDMQQFLSDVSGRLNIPQEAIGDVQIDLDRSGDEGTVIKFVLKTVSDTNGGYTNPLQSARDLQRFAEQPQSLAMFTTLQGLTVESDPTDAPESKDLSAAHVAAPALATAAVFLL
jgi:hypothetical protein